MSEKGLVICQAEQTDLGCKLQTPPHTKTAHRTERGALYLISTITPRTHSPKAPQYSMISALPYTPTLSIRQVNPRNKQIIRTDLV